MGQLLKSEGAVFLAEDTQGNVIGFARYPSDTITEMELQSPQCLISKPGLLKHHFGNKGSVER
jgi:hypothetical protein